MPRLLVSAVALLFALAGCGGDPVADPMSTPSTPVSTAPTTTPAPTMPAPAGANTKVGAIAFVRHYVDLINYAQATGDLTELSSVEAKECESCTSGRKYLDVVYNNGGHIEGGDLTIDVGNALRNESIVGWTVDGTLTYGPQVVVRPSSTPSTENLSGGGVPITVLVSYQSERWVIFEWTRAR
jgi:hypothetical protein